MAIHLPLGPIMLDLEGNTSLSQADVTRLQDPLVGGVILFSRNYQNREQMRDLTGRIRGLRDPPLLVAVDQEGGRVQRFKDGFVPLPCAARYGELYDQDPERGLHAARAAGWVMARQLKQTNIDFSFAPVLDLQCDAGDVIGDRAFHRAPEVTTILAGAFVDGMQQAGMHAIGKHFPGHGGVRGDSHVTLPRDPRRFDQLRDHDLVPFARLAHRLGGMMTAHVLFENIDAATPTYSEFWLLEVLRGQLAFDGVIFSDDLAMRGAGTVHTMHGRAQAAVAAGCDMVLMCNDLSGVEQVLARLKHAPTPDLARRLDALRGPRAGPACEPDWRQACAVVADAAAGNPSKV